MMEVETASRAAWEYPGITVVLKSEIRPQHLQDFGMIPSVPGRLTLTIGHPGARRLRSFGLSPLAVRRWRRSACRTVWRRLDDSRIAHTNGVDLDHVRKMLLKKRFVIRGKVPAQARVASIPKTEGADENRPP